MRESTKDKIETSSAWLLESATSAIPIIGPPMALAINKIIAAGDARRVQNQIAELHQILGTAVEAGSIGLPALESDEFLANLHFVIRQLQETSQADKRDRLTHALVTGAQRKWASQAEQFTRIIARLEEPHILALSAFYEIAGGTHRRVWDGTVLVLKKLSARGIQRSENYYKVIFEQLAAESLIVIDSLAETADQRQRFHQREDNDRQPEQELRPDRSGSTLKLTNTGMSFLAFLRKPETVPETSLQESSEG